MSFECPPETLPERMAAARQQTERAGEYAIVVDDVSKCYHVYETPSDRLKQALYPRVRRALGMPAQAYFREFWALRNVSLTVKPGETVGIIGRNGSGKSTLLQLICGTLSPTAGSIQTNGRIAALLELGSGFNPEFSGRENIFMNAAVLGMADDEIHARYQQIVDFSEIGEFIEQPVKTYSSGMFMRLAFAVQAHIDASVIVIDEALTVGDVFFRQKCYTRLQQLREAGAAILLVSHSMPDIEQFCERALLLDHGNARFVGPAAEAAKHYYLLHQPAAQRIADSTAPSDDSAVSKGDVRDRPVAEAFLDISDKVQVTTGRARCRGVALLDERGQPRSSFQQGEMATFYYEFEVDGDIGVPICGMTITNERGVIVHGKNSLQYPEDVAATDTRSSVVACHQQVRLSLAAGEYTFEIGLAAASPSDWKSRDHRPYEAEMEFVQRICHIANVGSFSIRMGSRDGITYLTHHGVADLPGGIRVGVS
jgi:lipopolysaccharide transport system ATP-binding protein